MSNEVIASDRGTVFAELVRILEEMTADWDNDFDGAIRPESSLIQDLGFESIDVVQLIVAIEETFHRRDLPFEKLLMEDGRYVEDVTVGAFVDFLEQHLGR